MGTKRPRDDQTPDARYLISWRTFTLGITNLLDRVRRVYTGVVLRRLDYARSSGILPAIVDQIQSTTRPIPRPL